MACCGPLIGLSFSCFLLFSGLFWPGPFFPIFRLWIPKRCKGATTTTLNLVQPPWNFVAEFGIAGNPNKGHSVSSQLDQTEPRYCRRIPSLFASLSHGLYSRSRARVALGRELQLPMSFPWSVFPGLDQDLFPPMVFLVFWDSIPKRCKGVHCVDLGESFPTSIYLQNLASIQPRMSPKKFGKNGKTGLRNFLYPYPCQGI